jgi:hypothetical protein
MYRKDYIVMTHPKTAQNPERVAIKYALFKEIK